VHHAAIGYSLQLRQSVNNNWKNSNRTTTTTTTTPNALSPAPSNGATTAALEENRETQLQAVPVPPEIHR